MAHRYAKRREPVSASRGTPAPVAGCTQWREMVPALRREAAVPDLFHVIDVAAPPADVFRAIATGEGLARWWTSAATGAPGDDALYELDFGPDHHWIMWASCCEPGRRFELTPLRADPDWMPTRIRFELLPAAGGGTHLRFMHVGWTAATEHFAVSNTCWAMYLRHLRRYLETGAVVPYAERLAA